MKLLEDYIKVYSEVFREDECKHLRDKIDQEQLTEVLDESFSYRTKSIHAVPEWADEDLVLTSLAFHAAQEYFDEVKVPLIPQIEGFEPVRVIKMQDNDFMDVHVDVNSQLSAKRYLTVIAFFSDFEGEIIFPSIDTHIIPKMGSVLVFPSTWMFAYAFNPNKGTTNHFAMTYLHYINT